LVDSDSAHHEALKMLARREMSVAEVRARLEDREFQAEDIEEAIARLRESGALDDGRVARAYARTAATVKGRGRLRVMQELLHMGISKAVASEALGDVFGELDERSLIAKALHKKLRGRTTLKEAGEYGRLYQHLMRQGFSPAGVAAALRRFRPGAAAQDDSQE
jgi:regulatory protein